jgi:DNA-binding GntR family transcriptional regulator
MDELKKITNRAFLNEIAYERIKTLILTGKVQRGEKLVVEELARQLGISRTPVREALLLLVQEGLAVSIPNRGTFVAEINRRQVLEIYQVRSVLEPLAVRLATPRIPEEELNRIARWAQSIKGEIGKTDDRSSYTDFDVAFHALAINHCGNEILKDSLSQLTDKLYVRTYPDGLPFPYIQASLEEHSKVLAAMMERDTVAAERLMAEHMRLATERMARFLAPDGMPKGYAERVDDGLSEMNA